MIPGSGSLPRHRKLLFAPFSQVDQGRTRRFGGTGLGLAISKRLTELMGGVIGVESDVRRGSTFWVEIPLAAADPSRIRPAGDGGVQPGRRIAANPDAPILVVEDNALNREVITKILGALGHPSHTAASGEEALLVLAETHVRRDPDGLRDAGHGWLRDHRRDPPPRGRRRSRIPIIVVSAHAMAGERERALEAGADGFLPKPVVPEELAEALGLGTREAEAAAPQAEVIDGHALERLRAVSGSREEFVSEMVDLFLQDAPAQLDLMRDAFSNRDASKLRAHAHRLVGSCRYLGAIGMTRTLDAIKTAADSGSWNRVGPLLEHLDADLAAARRELVRISKAGAQS